MEFLSMKSRKFIGDFPITSAMRQLRHTPWYVVAATATYSASHEDVAATFCFCEDQVTVMSPRKKATPYVLLRSFTGEVDVAVADQCKRPDPLLVAAT
jgi:hypothetical protein